MPPPLRQDGVEMPDRLFTLVEITRSRVVRVGGAGALSLGVYDSASSQFELPKLRAVLGMTGPLLPWWGWLLILQAVFIYGLFEYVRRVASGRALTDDSPVDNQLAGKIHELDARHAELVVAFASKMTQLEEDAARLARHREQQAAEWGRHVTQEGIVIASLQKSVDRIETNQSLDLENSQTLFGKFRMSVSAILHREKMREIASVINERASDLSALIGSGASLDLNQWQVWTIDEQNWRAAIFDWCQYAALYMPRALAHIEEVDQRTYDGAWTIEDRQFPTAAAVHKYKLFRLAYRNWQAIREIVAKDVYRAAFETPFTIVAGA